MGFLNRKASWGIITEHPDSRVTSNVKLPRKSLTDWVTVPLGEALTGGVIDSTIRSRAPRSQRETVVSMTLMSYPNLTLTFDPDKVDYIPAGSTPVPVGAIAVGPYGDCVAEKRYAA